MIVLPPLKFYFKPKCLSLPAGRVGPPYGQSSLFSGFRLPNLPAFVQRAILGTS